MTITSAVRPVEGSTAKITITFRDEDDALVTPNAGLKWKLTDMKGNSINNRFNVPVAVPASTINLALTGRDLKIMSELDDGRRLLTIDGTYDSNLGSNLTLKESLEFTIDQLEVVITGDVVIEMGVVVAGASIKDFEIT